MLITKEDVYNLLLTHNIKVKGALHVGAHDCEEIDFYHLLGLSNTDIVWIDALQEKVDENYKKGICNVFQSVISDKEGDIVTFSITNNIQSSSILELGSHATHYPHITVIEKRVLSTSTIDNFMKINSLDLSKYNFWNFDIQGAELKALMGSEKSLQYVDALYLEINIEDVYKGCAKLHELDSFLTIRGFSRITMKLVDQGWGDALYIRTN
jgi:FkbM family methyltransferase